MPSASPLTFKRLLPLDINTPSEITANLERGKSDPGKSIIN